MGSWALAGLMLSIPFTGKPTNLVCDFPGPDKAASVAVEIDGSQRAVTLTTPATGRTEHQKASLSGASISFDSPLSYGNVNYAINRTDLTVVRTNAGPTAPAIVTRGQCKLAPVVKRVF